MRCRTALTVIWDSEVRGFGVRVTTWEDFDAKFGDVIAEAFEKIRYCAPDAMDTNRARWPNHEIWELAKVDSDADLSEMRSHVDASAVKEVHKADQIKMILALTLGNCTTLAALEGVESDDLQGYMQDMGGRALSLIPFQIHCVGQLPFLVFAQSTLNLIEGSLSST